MRWLLLLLLLCSVLSLCCCAAVAVASEAEQRVRSDDPDPMPAYVADARACFAEYGFAYVPNFGDKFASKFLSHMQNFNRKKIKSGPGVLEHLSNNNGVQIFLPTRSDGGADAAAAAAAGKHKHKPGSEWIDHSLDVEWDKLCEELAVYVGAIQEEDVPQYHTQDSKVSSALPSSSSSSSSSSRFLSSTHMCARAYACVLAAAVHAGRRRRARRVRAHSLSRFFAPQLCWRALSQSCVGVCAVLFSHADSDKALEMTAQTFTVLLYMSEGSHSTAFPDFPKHQLPMPQFEKEDSDAVLNQPAMRTAVEVGLLEPVPGEGRGLQHFKRWTVHQGDMAIFSQDVMHHGTVVAGASAERLTLFSILTKYPDKRQDAAQIFRYEPHSLSAPSLAVLEASSSHTLSTLSFSSLLCMLSWTYVNHAFGTQSRQVADMLWKNRDFDPLKNEEEQSYKAYLNCLIRFHHLAKYDPKQGRKPDAVKMVSAADKRKIDARQPPLPPLTDDEVLERLQRGVPLPEQPSAQAPATRSSARTAR